MVALWTLISRSSTRRRSPSVNTPSICAAIDHDAHAEAFLRHHHQPVAERRRRPDDRQVFAGAHHVGDVQQQFAAERAAGMRAREILRREAARFEHCHRERIAERERGGGAGRGREIERAGLFCDAHVEVDAGGARQVRIRIAGHGDDGNAEAGEVRNQQQHFGGFAGVGDRQQHVVARDHADVAMAGFGRMHEERRGAGGGERGGDLAGDMAGFAHAADDDAAVAFEADAAGARETRVESRHQRGDRAALDLESPASGGDQRGRIGLELGIHAAIITLKITR